ncbi:hypothetical protein Slin15195_G031960 [Septoria linicola]|uniref:F-box domain-containing protein n=1 Tax=Septoria linicola TaxID=215465 RepID=A0A9Q9EHF8_9PEZI|nr:hypothetical protein Slin14017_G030980 [Septoria linicola]USW49877.1 hypothetical protein Slin15195_G031960 [Septoria linicola]
MTDQAPPNSAQITQQSCRFLELPAELRIVIYELVLLQDDSVDITATMEGSHFRDPPLLRTCCQISLEATPIYYSHNTFSCLQFHLPDDDVENFVGLQWLESLGKWRRSKLTKVRIQHGIRLPQANKHRDQHERDSDRIFRQTREDMWLWLDEYAHGLRADVVSVRPF